MGGAAGQVEDDLDILAAGVEDLEHMLVVDEQVEQRREVDPLRLGVDRRRLLAVGDLEQAQVRPIGVLAHELGVDRDEVRPGEPFAELFEGLGVGDEGMDVHLAALIAAASALDKAPSVTRSARQRLFPNLLSESRSPMHAYRTHNCGQLRESDVGARVKLSGWVHRKRDHGGVLFVDLRDHYGLTQIVARAGSEPLAILEHLRAESVVTIEGEVVAARARGDQPEPADRRDRGRRRQRHRPVRRRGAAAAGGRRGRNIPRISACATAISTCGASGCTPISCCARKVISSIRRRMIDQGFTEFQTPILTASSPEGARDYLVPSRVHPGQILRAPAGAADVQAADHGRRLRPLFPDRALLPRRGRPRRPLARANSTSSISK